MVQDSNGHDTSTLWVSERDVVYAPTWNGDPGFALMGSSGSGGTFEQVAGANDDSEPEEQPECDHVCLPISERREDVALVSWP